MTVEDAAHLDRFFESTAQRPLLGLVYGRRRIGKSYMLSAQVRARGGFYFEATRVETPLQLERLGRDLGDYLGHGRIALRDWEEATGALIRLGADHAIPVVLDEFGHVLEADRSVDSVIASAFGPGGGNIESSSVRLVLCGSAIALMRSLTAGSAPLRGRAGLELVMQPDDFRVAASRLTDPDDLVTATRVFAVIGGVVGYATDMVNFDLPAGADDFDRWVAQRVLSPAATLHREATTLLAEDPGLAGANSLMHHSILGAIANGSVTAGAIANKVGRPVSNLTPAVARLIDAGFVTRHEDPVRTRRPLYALADPYLQFHYAVLEPNGPVLRDRDPVSAWAHRLAHTFDAQVRGPVFEEQARTWVRRFASDSTLAVRDHVGPSHASIDDVDHQLDLVAAGPGITPGERAVAAIGEAKAGETVGIGHLRRLELARGAFGTRALDAKLLLFAAAFNPELVLAAGRRSDVELIDLDRLHRGS